MNGAYRPAEADSYYWRCTQILWPFYHMIPGGVMGEGVRIGAYVPMDDEHHMQWEIGVFKPDGTAADPRANQRGLANMNSPLGSRRIPNGTGWYERHRSDQNLTNDFLINREEQASGKSFTAEALLRPPDWRTRPAARAGRVSRWRCAAAARTSASATGSWERAAP